MWFVIKVEATKVEIASVFVVRACNYKKKKEERMFHVWFVIKATTVKEGDPHMIHHQSRNYRRRCAKCGSSLKPQL